MGRISTKQQVNEGAAKAPKQAKTTVNNQMVLQSVKKPSPPFRIPITAVLESFEEGVRDRVKQKIDNGTQVSPTVVFVWEDLHPFLARIQDNVDDADCPLRNFLPTQRPVTATAFKTAVMKFVVAQAPGVSHSFGGVVRCSYNQATHVSAVLASLRADNWMKTMCKDQSLPLAKVVRTIRRNAKKMELLMLPGVKTLNLWS